MRPGITFQVNVQDGAPTGQYGNWPMRRREAVRCFGRARLIDELVVRHDHMGLLADAQLIVAGEMTLELERVYLFDQNLRIDDHAIADHAEFISVQSAGGDQV